MISCSFIELYVNSFTPVLETPFIFDIKQKIQMLTISVSLISLYLCITFTDLPSLLVL